MKQIPDAPWIRDAERNGIEIHEYFCPECGEACDTIYIRDGYAVGCDNCITAIDAWDYDDD